jgi:hypothetical protein
MNKPDCARSITSLYPASRTRTSWSLYPPRERPRLPNLLKSLAIENHRLPEDEDMRSIVAAQKLTTIHHTGAVTHVAIPNPNFERGMDIPRFAAIRIASCVTEEEQQNFIRLVLGVQKVRYIANTFDFYANQPGRRKVQHYAHAR